MIARSVEPADYAEWLTMRSALWPHCTSLRHESEMQEYATRGGSFVTFLATDAAGQICGFIEASIRTNAEGCTTTPVGYIEGIFVQPASRRRGVGRLLVSAAEGWASSQGCSEFASDCHADNEASIEFHRRLGFAISKQLVHFRRTLAC